jgi:hypothetical protein
MSCAQKQETAVRINLEMILADDLKGMSEEIPVSEKADSSYYIVREFKYFPKDVTFSYLAEVDFYYLRNIKYKQIRKYRYYRSLQKWDRYFKKYENIL